MALASTNITPIKANVELGSPFYITSNLSVKDVCEVTGQNRFSFYGPWHLKTDTNKVCQVDYGTSNYRLGDFRLYNHSTTSTGIPKGADDFEQKYTSSTATVVLVSYVYNMNVLDALSNAYSTSALRICSKFYTTSAARTAGTSPAKTDIQTLGWGTSSLAGHIRTATSKASSQQLKTITGVPITAPYVDTYISDISGTRLLTLGTAISGGYTKLSFWEDVPPYFQGSPVNITPAPVTGMHTAISASSTKCNDDSSVSVTAGTSWSMTVRLKGQYYTSQYLVSATNATVTFKLYNRSNALIETDTQTGKTFNNESSTAFSGTFSNSMGNGYHVTVGVSSATLGTRGTACP